ncbi:hypothetical protein P8452_43197 [Trifolium repens]|nr:hypothetical protein P8452_43197 [Trifolium repens]
MDHNNLQQSILGETAFEDFLTHAKAFNMGNQDNVHVIGDANQVPFIGIESKLAVMASQPEHWLPFQMPIPIQMQQHHQEHQNRPIIEICQDFNVAKPVYENQIMDIGYSENSLAMSMPIGATTMSFPLTCSDSKGVVTGAVTDDRVGVGRKHKYSDEMMEKTIERRQKRMAKNRESAARSRAKKQEHINKLHEDRDRLQKINMELKMKKKIDEWLFPNLTPRYQLRRISSAKF